jgi:hypothetical protein
MDKIVESVDFLPAFDPVVLGVKVQALSFFLKHDKNYY